MTEPESADHRNPTRIETATDPQVAYYDERSRRLLNFDTKRENPRLRTRYAHARRFFRRLAESPRLIKPPPSSKPVPGSGAAVMQCEASNAPDSPWG